MIQKAALKIGVPALLAFIAWNAYLDFNHLKRVQKIAALALETSTIQAEPATRTITRGTAGILGEIETD